MGDRVNRARAAARRVRHAALLGTAVGALVFVASGLAQRRQLLMRQPPHTSGLPIPPDATGFPVAAAWVFAALFGGLAFVVVFAVAAVMLKRRP